MSSLSTTDSTKSSTAMHSTSETSNKATWAHSLLTSIRDFFIGDPASRESDADAVEGWVGVRTGRGRCRSIGEVH
ncbi:uncharacterized protein N7473_003747 [Penicillium subrubescens]|uniref:uncharacterized protein n=1 Tax=Penicillium subrubescens TaxID=1316194 RepID=UPI0025451C9A|nr:uncharacterized protein N7473_003747 [Penicillium subrubescens]KAJ5906831.1 hypothetical protein N7473_003747 [Penicillium subrubescens]